MDNNMFYVENKIHTDEENIKLKDLNTKKEHYIKRPPYQRKSVWSISKQQRFIESIFRKYFIPKIVLRVVLPREGVQKFGVVDGQQRIVAIQNFLENKFKTSLSLNNLKDGLGSKFYSELAPDVKEYIEESGLKATIIKTLDKPQNKTHQKEVADIFWRLNDGVSLSNMEKEHSKVYSGFRNFVVKYADDLSFDNEKYVELDSNNFRHDFFKIVGQKNDRLQNLSLLSRFLIIEFNKGPAELKDEEISKLMDKFQDTSLTQFEELKEVKGCKKMLDVLFRIFNQDKFKNKQGRIILLYSEYFIISIYILLRDLCSGKYNFSKENYEDFRKFIDDFFKRWKKQDEKDYEIIKLSNKRQQDKNSSIYRDIVLKKSFFKKNPNIEKLDSKRNFNLWERIEIYQREGGICQKCRKEIPWNEFEADHIVPHSKKGESDHEKNGQLLCLHCNRQKGNKLE